MNIPLKLIDSNPWQTRHGDPDPAYIKELAIDISAKGLLQTPMGRLMKSGRPFDYAPFGGFIHQDELASVLEEEPDVRVQLAFGHNRLAAYQWLLDVAEISNLTDDWTSMPVELRELTNEQMADFAWSENERRRDVDPISRALAVRKRIADFHWTQEQAAEHLGISRPAISNLLRLLKLPADVQAHLTSGQISPRQADALLSLFSLPEEIRKKAEIHWEENVKPSAILNAAVEGESSENTRKRVTQLTERYAEKLNNAPWSLALVFADYPNRHAPACSQCDARLDEGNWNYCTLPECFRSRYKVFQQDYLQRAGQVCAIPPLEGDRDLYRTTSLYKEHAQILATKCENLRLIYEGRHNGAFPHPEGFPEARILCQKQNQFCTCLKGLEQMQKSAARPQAAESQALPDGSQAPDQMQDSALSGPTAEELEDAARIARVAQRERRRQG